ncbi:MAG: hypothetical protein ACRDFS_08190, partial [Chloroflexota bacterium]
MTVITRWERPSGRKLIKLLAAISPHRVHQEEAMELLWPELDAGAAVLDDSIWIDADHFHQLAMAALAHPSVAALEDAQKLYPGEPLLEDRYEEGSGDQPENAAVKP